MHFQTVTEKGGTTMRRKSLNTLRKEAAAAAHFRGHKRLSWMSHACHEITGTCTTCGAEVQCLVYPLPNEIDIGGEAVALTCPAN